MIKIESRILNKKHIIYTYVYTYILNGDFPGGSAVKNLPGSARGVDWIPESGRSPGGGNENFL